MPFLSIQIENEIKIKPKTAKYRSFTTSEISPWIICIHPFILFSQFPSIVKREWHTWQRIIAWNESWRNIRNKYPTFSYEKCLKFHSFLRTILSRIRVLFCQKRYSSFIKRGYCCILCTVSLVFLLRRFLWIEICPCQILFSFTLSFVEMILRFDIFAYHNTFLQIWTWREEMFWPIYCSESGSTSVTWNQRKCGKPQWMKLLDAY